MTVSWAPDVEQVHSVIPQRANGGFTQSSIPSQAQVGSVIDQVTAEVVAEVGAFDPSRVISQPGDEPATTLGGLARWVATLGAASYVEIGFFPEQQQLGDTVPGQILFQRYQGQLAHMKTIIDRFRTEANPQRFVNGSIVTPLASVAHPDRRIVDRTL